MANPRKNENGLNSTQERWCELYVNSIGSSIDEESLLELAGYKFTGPDRQQKQNRLHLLKELKTNKNIQARISQLIKERDNAMVFDRRWVQEQYIKLYNSTTKEALKKQVLDSCAKVLDMFSDNTVIVDKSTDPAQIAKEGYKRALEKDKLKVVSSNDD